ncbi:MAG: tetratricopeptide repeat protein [Alphaproteobacteria bacterium]|nr:tetratricopeptide repeat protein [Alphaproteobacteria bacterium]
MTIALAHHQGGRLAEAKRCYEEILADTPNEPNALHLLGVIALQEGSAETSEGLIRQAIAINPKIPEPFNNLGNVLKELGRLDEAEAAFREAIRLKPDYPEAYNNLGNALRDQGKSGESIAAYGKSLELDASVAEVHNNLAGALYDLGRLGEAEAEYRKALDIKPDYLSAQRNLAVTLKDQGKVTEAINLFREVLKAAPESADVYGDLGNALRSLGRLREAKEAYNKVLELKPDSVLAHNSLGITLKSQGRISEAYSAYRRALELDPKFFKAHSNLVFDMNYDEAFSQAEIFSESRRWDTVHGAAGAANAARGHGNVPDPDRRLRIGYVSPDFREHSVGYFLEPLIANHDRTHYEVFCYAEVSHPSHITQRFRKHADGWHSTVGERDDVVAERIREDGVDILVDLAGHTANHRLGVFTYRPAPVQVTWLGYPNTTGLSAMDYRLTDAVADPEGANDAYYSETLVRLPDGFLCYAPSASAPDIGPLPALETGRVTFGSFNNLSKVTPKVVEAWSRLLEKVEGSRLIIKSGPMADEETRQRYEALFAECGIGSERLELLSRIPSKSGHLGAYGRVDIGLDPFPYNGTTTTCEALWMGVPVVTLLGDRHSGRVGASLLTRLGLTELIAEDREAYVETAVALAGDLDRLAGLRARLRQRMTASPLCDAKGFARRIEAAYRRMWGAWCAKHGSGRNEQREADKKPLS